MATTDVSWGGGNMHFTYKDAQLLQTTSWHECQGQGIALEIRHYKLLSASLELYLQMEPLINLMFPVYWFLSNLLGLSTQN